MADRVQTTVTRLLGELQTDNRETLRERFPLVDPLHSKPRFQSLLARVGLADDDVGRAHVS